MLGIESISGTPFLVGTDVFKGSDTLPLIHLIFLETLNLLSFNRLKGNIEVIKNIIVNEFIVYNIKFVIKAHLL